MTKLDLTPRGQEPEHLAREAPITYRERQIIAEHAIRWARNILTEVLSNHGRFLSEHQRDTLRAAVTALGAV